ncbi:MAG: hypothetical protein Q9195_005052 [Heterodermia aff. obscurata]
MDARTIAQNFSNSLNETFAIDDNPKLEGLLQSVEEKKQAVTSQSQELEALEAKLRETEARLNQKKKQSRTSSPSGGIGETSLAQRRKPVPSAFVGQDDRAPARGDSSLAAPHRDVASQAYSRWEGLLPQGGERRV